MMPRMPQHGGAEGQIREIADLEAATRFAWVKLLVDSKSLLSAEQKAEFKKLMKVKKEPMMKQMKAGPKKDKPVKDKPDKDKPVKDKPVKDKPKD